MRRSLASLGPVVGLVALVLLATLAPETSGATFTRPTRNESAFTAASSWPVVPSSGLVWWLDASNAGTLFSNTSCTTPAGVGVEVECWQDVRFGGSQLTASDGPVRNGTGINGLSTLQFTPNQRIFGPDLLGGSVSDLHVFAVLRENTGSSDFFISLHGTSTGAWARLSLHSPWSTTREWYWDPGNAYASRATSAAGVTSVGDVTLVTAWMDATGATNGLRLDSTLQYLSSSTSAADTTGGLSVGTQDGTHVVTDRDLAELLVYDRYLTTGEQTAVEDYLRSKWDTP